MDERARALLEKLLRVSDKKNAGVRSRAASLTKTDLATYRSERSLNSKEAFEGTMRAASAQGAVTLTWDDPRSQNGFVSRVDIADRRALAVFLGITPLEDMLTFAKDQFAPIIERFPVLNDVIDRWSLLRRVRALGPDSVQDWVDATQVIDSARGVLAQASISVPIREASYRIFKDSKRIEKIAGPVDVLLCASVESDPREPAAVWEELGLFREEHPVLLAGNVAVRRDRVTTYLDAPYCGLPAATIQGLASIPMHVMSIENKTTFHSEARRHCNENVLLIYTAGMPSPAWRAMYHRLLKDVPVGTPIFHWGDVDEGGFRIASTLARDALVPGHILKPWNMHPNDIPEGVRKNATPYVLGRIRHFATAAGWQNLGEAVADAGFTIEQEGLA